MSIVCSLSYALRYAMVYLAPVEPRKVNMKDINNILALSVSETSKRLGLSRSLTYEAIRTGQIPSIRVGRRILIPVTALQHLLSGAGASRKEDCHSE